MTLPGRCWTFPRICPHCGSDQAAGFALRPVTTQKITEDKKKKTKKKKKKTTFRHRCIAAELLHIFSTGCPTLVIFIERSIYSVHVKRRLLNAVRILKP